MSLRCCGCSHSLCCTGAKRIHLRFNFIASSFNSFRYRRGASCAARHHSGFFLLFHSNLSLNFADQSHAHRMWLFAFMLQFTDNSFSTDPALRGIVLLVNSLTNAIISHGHASNAPWVEFLPYFSPSSIDVMSTPSEIENEALAAATSKDNVLLIALSKYKEAARHKASVLASFHSHCLPSFTL